MKSTKKLFLLAAFTSIVAVACSADGPEEPKDRNTDYTGLFDPIQVELQAKHIEGTKATLDLPLASGATVTAELELMGGDQLVPGAITVQLNPDALFAVDLEGKPFKVAAAEAGTILNDAGARSVCGKYPLSDVGTVRLADGQVKNVGVSLVASEVAYADGTHKGCRTIQDPGLPNASCGDDCEIGIGFFTWSGKCDHWDITVPYYIQGQWIQVPMWLCYCNATAQASATPADDDWTVSTEEGGDGSTPTETP